MAHSLSHPDALEKIFQKLEQESERRAQQLVTSDSAVVAANRAANRERRRTSVSISRFGQLDNPQTTTFSIPTTPTFVPPHIYTQHPPHSTDSLESTSSTETAHERRRESNHVTQVHRIAARQSLGRSVGAVLQRTLSRSRSKPQLAPIATDVDVVIGVVVEEAATVEPHSGETRPESRAMAYADLPATRPLRSQTSRFTIAAAQPAEGKGLVDRARELGRRIRRRAQTVVDTDRP